MVGGAESGLSGETSGGEKENAGKVRDGMGWTGMDGMGWDGQEWMGSDDVGSDDVRLEGKGGPQRRISRSTVGGVGRSAGDGKENKCAGARMASGDGRSLRIGYVNIRGLTGAKWQWACGALEKSFDLLFLGETWFVDRVVDRRDRRIVACSTEMPKGERPRGQGGVYLLATARARGRLRKRAEVGENRVTVELEGRRISGVYLPPSLSAEDVRGVLGAVANSAVIMGDMNVRFAGIPLRKGQRPGPQEREKVFGDFGTQRRFRPLGLSEKRPTGLPKGVVSTPWLDLDHCLVCEGVHITSLWAVVNASWGLRGTDHTYTLYLQIGDDPLTKQHPEPGLCRFKNGLLCDADVCAELRAAFESASEKGMSRLFAEEDVDRLDDKLVQLCQRVARQVLGPASRATSRKSRAGGQKSGEDGRGGSIERGPKRVDPVRQRLLDRKDVGASIQLFKSAQVNSKANEVIIPTPEAAGRGVTALEEIGMAFGTLFAGRAFVRPKDAGCTETTFRWTSEEVCAEIRLQDSTKCAGGDGIHTKLMKALDTTSFVKILARLYSLCLDAGRTPRRWNSTEIHLVTKDSRRARDRTNLRPITLIPMFRKVFERLLLGQFHGGSWAKLHRAQAGFRKNYGINANAGVLHWALASGSVNVATFLDFRAAFDTVDHHMLALQLRKRGCPQKVFDLICALCFYDVRSRVMVNGDVTDWIPRTRGVVQGSPLSPYLFNFIVDPLLYELNVDDRVTPWSMFFADDGVLLTESLAEATGLLLIVLDWCKRFGIELNADKCGWVGPAHEQGKLVVEGELIPKKDEYKYLGFPMTATGIDFPKMLRDRIAKALRLTGFLSRFSDGWGPGHRLTIYKQYVRPIILSAGPLVGTWAYRMGPRGERAKVADNFADCTTEHDKIITWVAGCGAGRQKLAANILGLPDLWEQFDALRHTFWAMIEWYNDDKPLRKLFSSPQPTRKQCAFPESMKSRHGWGAFWKGWNGEALKSSMQRYRRQRQRDLILARGGKSHLSKNIPDATRLQRRHYMADHVLKAMQRDQQILVKYRLGLFLLNARCLCSKVFTRGHEECRTLDVRAGLRKAERSIVAGIASRNPDRKVTQIDWLLNAGQLKRAAELLREIQRTVLSAKENVRRTTTAPGIEGTSGPANLGDMR